MTLLSEIYAPATSDIQAPKAPPTAASRKWIGRICAGLAIAFLAFDTAIKVLQLPPAVEGTVQLGFPAGSVLWIGLVEAALLLLYVVPRTAPLGAVLWTGYLGGAIAIHVRLGNPLWSHQLFPIYIAVLLWLPLWLRDVRVRELLQPMARRS